MKNPCKFLSDLHILMGLIKENDSSRPVSLNASPELIP